MDGARVHLTSDSLVLRNLKGAMYKMTVEDMAGCIIGMAAVNDHIFVSVANHGIHTFRIQGSKITQVGHLGEKGSNCYDLLASPLHFAYIMEYEKTLKVCIHEMSSLLTDNDVEPICTYKIQRCAPMVLLSDVNLLVLGGEAWMTSWTTEDYKNGAGDVLDESHVVIIELRSCRVQANWKATSNAVSLLRTQTYKGRSMLGVADSRAGLTVYDMTHAVKSSPRSAEQYKILYQVPVDEIRNFQLVGGYVAVFHRFEPNVSFWNMTEQRTILCINIQDQMKELSEEFLEPDGDDDTECLFTDDDDHVTAVTSIAVDDDFILIYATMSGCVFGMSVAHRTKLFNIPCPHMADATVARRIAHGISFMPGGKIAVGYEHCGLTLMDFSPENPPPRPPTRSQRRPRTS